MENFIFCAVFIISSLTKLIFLYHVSRCDLAVTSSTLNTFIKFWSTLNSVYAADQVEQSFGRLIKLQLFLKAVIKSCYSSLY